MGKQMVFVAVALAAIGVQTKLAPPKIEDYTFSGVRSLTRPNS